MMLINNDVNLQKTKDKRRQLPCLASCCSYVHAHVRASLTLLTRWQLKVQVSGD